MISAMKGGLNHDFPVVICYTGIFLRDHWEEVTSLPWWAPRIPDLSGRLGVEEDLQEKLDLDWVPCGMCPARDWRENHSVRTEGGRVYMVDLTSGTREELKRSPVGGNRIEMLQKPLIESSKDIGKRITVIGEKDFLGSGRLDYVHMLKERFGNEKFLVASIASPFWSSLMSHFGLGGMLIGLFRKPELVAEVLEEVTRSRIEVIRAYISAGVDGFWIEECLTSASEISREQYTKFVYPYTKRIIDEIRRLGGKSIYYFCGDVGDRLDLVVESGPDSVSLEESKKNFEIDIAWVDEVVGGRCCILGNLDSIGVLQNGDREALRSEIRRQIEVGRGHGKFVMSLGSPVTPKTTVQRVRDYVDITREESVP